MARSRVLLCELESLQVPHLVAAALHDRDGRAETGSDRPPSRSHCFCGAEIDIAGTDERVYAAHMETA